MEHHALLTKNNPSPCCLHQLFEAQVARTPNATAIVFEEQQLTYHELNLRANQLAHYLKKQGIGTEVLVGIGIERSLEMVIGLLGILKAGGAYLPLDPGLPKQRLAFMLSDSQLTVLLTQHTVKDELPVNRAKIIALDTEWERIAQESQQNPLNPVNVDNLAYVIYTSGSTGKPKGVMIPHRAIYNHTVWMQTTFPLTTTDKVLQKTPFHFDASVWEFFSPLSVGAQLYLAKPGGHQESAYLVKVIIEQQITVLQTVPSLLQMLLEAPNFDQCHSLKRLFCGGESLSVKLQQQFFAQLNADLINLYGPTETCIDASFFICQPKKYSQKIPMGSPIDQLQIHLLDSTLKPAPVGSVGEIYLGGVGLARGYLNRPDLTAEKFIPNQKGALGTRLYKTGDLARRLPDGNLEFCGRIDNQVKIRGFRIELGEIEARLSQHPEIQEVVVTAPEIAPADKRLIAYFIDKGGKIQDSQLLRQFLLESLPAYMIPAAFIKLNQMPLTPNGKIDRQALPLPNWEGTASAEGLPATVVEKKLFQLWKDILGVSQFSIHDNFFELGGHSLSATRLISQINETFQINLPLSHLFAHPTIAKLAAEIELKSKQSIVPSTEKIISFRQPELVGTFPLSLNQKSIWLSEQLYPNTPTYHIPYVYKLTGLLNVSALAQALTEIVRAHSVLRTCFESNQQELPQQRITPPAPFSITEVEISDSEIIIQQAIQNEARHFFKLAEDHLLRVTVFHLSSQAHILLFTFHHLIIDGWGIGIFLKQLTQLYAGFGKPIHQIPSRSSKEEIPQYRDFCFWQQDWLQSEQCQAQLTYWRSQLQGPLPALELPTDYPRPLVQTDQGARQAIVIPEKLTAALYQLSHQQHVTLFMLLLAAFKSLLFQYTKQTDFAVGTAIAGRQQVAWENTIGLFINNLVLRTQPTEQTPFTTFLAQVRKITLAAYDHQDLPFQYLMNHLQPERNLSHHPLFQTFFLLQNFEIPQLKLMDVTVTPLAVSTGTAKFDLTLELYEKHGQLTGWFEYNTALFTTQTMQRMARHFQNLLANIVVEPNKCLAKLSLLNEREKAELIRDFNEDFMDK